MRTFAITSPFENESRTDFQWACVRNLTFGLTIKSKSNNLGIRKSKACHKVRLSAETDPKLKFIRSFVSSSLQESDESNAGS